MSAIPGFGLGRFFLFFLGRRPIWIKGNTEINEENANSDERGIPSRTSSFTSLECGLAYRMNGSRNHG